MTQRKSRKLQKKQKSRNRSRRRSRKNKKIMGGSTRPPSPSLTAADREAFKKGWSTRLVDYRALHGAQDEEAEAAEAAAAAAAEAEAKELALAIEMSLQGESEQDDESSAAGGDAGAPPAPSDKPQLLTDLQRALESYVEADKLQRAASAAFTCAMEYSISANAHALSLVDRFIIVIARMEAEIEKVTGLKVEAENRHQTEIETMRAQHQQEVQQLMSQLHAAKDFGTK
jgi:hypothetical protein